MWPWAAHYWAAGHARSCEQVGRRDLAHTVHSIFDFFFLVNYSKNQFKILKSMENFRIAQKFENKVLWNP
jgi:hypothetical protein